MSQGPSLGVNMPDRDCIDNLCPAYFIGSGGNLPIQSRGEGPSCYARTGPQGEDSSLAGSSGDRSYTCSGRPLVVVRRSDTTRRIPVLVMAFKK